MISYLPRITSLSHLVMVQACFWSNSTSISTRSDGDTSGKLRHKAGFML